MLSKEVFYHGFNHIQAANIVENLRGLKEFGFTAGMLKGSLAEGRKKQ